MDTKMVKSKIVNLSISSDFETILTPNSRCSCVVHSWVKLKAREQRGYGQINQVFTFHLHLSAETVIKDFIFFFTNK